MALELPEEVERLRPSDKGSYVLEFLLPEPSEIAVGRLGTIRLEKGWYYYVGSALSGLRGRLGRHILGTEKRRWHVDYLVRLNPPVRLWYIICGKRLESRLVNMIEGLTEPVVPGFGCGDLKGDGTHLLYSAKRRNLTDDLAVAGRVTEVVVPAAEFGPPDDMTGIRPRRARR